MEVSTQPQQDGQLPANTRPQMEVQTPTYTPPQNPSKQNSTIMKILIAVIVILLGIIGVLFYQNQTRSKQTQQISEPPKKTAQETPIVSPTIQMTTSPVQRNNWKTYTNPIRHYSIQYPSTWDIDISKAQTKPESDEGATLIFTKSGYTLTILWPSAFGPGICIFDDQPKDGAPEMASYCKGQFVEYSSVSGNTTYRRLITPETLGDHVQWEVYTKNKDAFVTVPPTRFTAPVSFDASVIEEMDQILATLAQKTTYQTDVTKWKIHPGSSIVGLPYEFKYPPEFTVTDAQDIAIFKSSSSWFNHRWAGKTKDITALMDNYQEFAAPKVSFSSRTAATFGDYTGYKGITSDKKTIYYFLGNPTLNGVLVFRFNADDADMEKLFTQIASTIVMK